MSSLATQNSRFIITVKSFKSSYSLIIVLFSSFWNKIIASPNHSSWKVEKHGMINEYAERFSAEKVNLNTDWANNIQKVTPCSRSCCNKTKFISLRIDKHWVFINSAVRKFNFSHQRDIQRNENFIVLSGERIRWYLKSYFFCLSSGSAFDITFVKDICLFTTEGSGWLYVKVNELNIKKFFEKRKCEQFQIHEIHLWVPRR